MWGMQRMTVSPSSSSTSRSTPWVAGCWGPMLTIIGSAPNSSAGSPRPATRSGIRVGRPAGSSEGVASASSTVRVVT